MLLKLKARIIEKYGKQSRFAMSCGRGEQWISRIITGRQKPTDEDKVLLTRKLELEDDQYFLD